jgi:tetratricopeptide (TPR) repeat protein
MDRVKLAGAQSKDSKNAWNLCQSLEADLRGRSKRIDAGYLMNFGGYAIRQLELDRAIAYFQEAATIINPETRFNPFQKIAEIQMARGQWAEARVSLGHAWAWLQTKRSAVRLEMRRALKLTVARYYMLYGYPDKALEHLESAYAEPQRMRDSLDSAVRWKAEAVYQQAAALQARRDLFGGTEGTMAARGLDSLVTSARIWEAKQKFASLVTLAFAEPAAPLSALSVTTSPWPTGWLDMPAIYGKGSSNHLLASLGLDKSLEGYTPAFLAMAEGSGASAERLSAQALQTLPTWDLVARARMEQVLAESASDKKQAGVHYANAYKLHPPSLIGSRLPIRVNALPEMEAVHSALSKSESLRVTKSEQSFALDLAASKATLKDSGGLTLRELNFDSTEVTPNFTARLIRWLFSAESTLTEEELAVLDGNVISSSKPSSKARN